MLALKIGRKPERNEISGTIAKVQRNRVCCVHVLFSPF